MLRQWLNPAKARYYSVSLQQDLLGDWILDATWGSTLTQRGGMRRTLLEDRAQGLAKVEDIAKRRRWRGYHEVTRPVVS